jgi:putative acetyltransferase
VTAGPGIPFSVPGPEPFPVIVRLEAPGDEAAVRGVNRAAFPGPEEAAITDAIRAQGPEGWHSLVAVGAPGSRADGVVVGALLLSPAPIEDEDGTVLATAQAIGPVAVLPELQYRGIGSALMGAAIGLAIARGVPALVLLGHDTYYPRFGFVTARGVGLLPPTDKWPDQHWMAKLLPAWDDDFAGRVRFNRAFEPLA